MKVTVAVTRSNDPEVHKYGCADVTRGLKTGKYQDADDIDVSTKMDAADWFWGDIMAESDASPEEYRDVHTRFYPCVGNLPAGEAYGLVSE